jgi:uncharacterized membrane protein
MAEETLRAVPDLTRAGALERSVAPAVAQSTSSSTRLVALDWMRGIVMMLMAVDHSSKAFNSGRIVADSFFSYQRGAALPVAQFLTRFITHLCAPTFLFLAGTGLAFTVKRQLAKGDSPWAIDRYIATRGLVIAAFELWISWFAQPPHSWMLQVLYAIGVSLLFMVPLRRLPSGAALALALFLIAAGEPAVTLIIGSDRAQSPLWLALLAVGGDRPPVIISYPPVHWLPMLLLGWAWGNMLITKKPSKERIIRQLVMYGTAALVAFALIRGVNGYGNMLLYREGYSLVQWLHVSKYPPAIAYTTLELGIMALILAVLFQLSLTLGPRPHGLLVTLGQAPMFFYLLHYPLLMIASHVAGVEHQLGLLAAYAGAAGVVAILYPFCRWYRSFKATGQHPWTRYI